MDMIKRPAASQFCRHFRPMALPFFKKPDEKLPARPAAKPPAAARSPAGPATKPPSGPATKPPPDDDFGDLDFTGIQVVEEVDPLVGAIEHAAITFANDDDAGTEKTLRDGIKGGERKPEAERLWLMLFDFYLLTRKRDAFASLELVFARLFEMQPPVWRDLGERGAQAKVLGANHFKGDLVGQNAEGFAQLAQWLATSARAKIDFSKVKTIDAEGCEKLLACMSRSRKQKHVPEVSGCDALVTLIEPRVRAADGEQAYWRALLECYQMLGRQEDFENLAVEFAVNFEISPPSWEAGAVSTKPAKPVMPVTKVRPDDAFYLSGEVRGGRFEGLEAYLTDHPQAVVDLGEVTRMDFSSAGTLLNIVTPHHQRGAKITLRHPNRLVAELLGLMGIAACTTVVLARR